MSGCPALDLTQASGVAQALRLVDCRAAEATGVAFARLFGTDGVLLPALTILLTLYIAFLAIGLLTGRTTLGLSALTPRMMTLGLVLTFATSWVAYQSVVWSLAIGGPDQIASILLGSKGSATDLFANRVDVLFNAIADAATSNGAPAQAPAQGAQAAQSAAASFTPTDLMWVSALMLLLGTVGVLVTARIAMAAMLALGPIFIILALFGGTRGLFEGWLKAVVMLAVAPLFAILLGAGVLELAVPVVRALNQGGQVDGRTVAVLFLLSAVYIALMVMALKAAGAIVAGWRLPGSDARTGQDAGGGAIAAPSPLATAQATTAAPAATSMSAADASRVRAIAATLPAAANDGASAGGASEHRSRTIITHAAPAPAPASSPSVADRNRGLGSRFRPAGGGSFKEKRP
ncbi:type IV secretion system protein [Sphingomonas sp.]|uniref:type IV secretion system protein n=1 Tax=Sphingomonas sp. TaxID=28214 RepID=UPI003B3B849D